MSSAAVAADEDSAAESAIFHSEPKKCLTPINKRRATRN